MTPPARVELSEELNVQAFENQIESLLIHLMEPPKYRVG